MLFMYVCKSASHITMPSAMNTVNASYHIGMRSSSLCSVSDSLSDSGASASGKGCFCVRAESRGKEQLSGK